jgi:hypothetical protein
MPVRTDGSLFSTGWPIIGTTLPYIPLDSVSPRFQITLMLPGYRNYCSQGGREPLDSESWSLFRLRLPVPHHQT